MPDSNYLKKKRPVEYGEERFYHYDKYCVDYDGHWAGQDRKVWTYKSYFTNSLDEAIRWYKKVSAPKKIRQRLEGCWCSLNIDKIIAPQPRNYIQQEFNFEWE